MNVKSMLLFSAVLGLLFLNACKGGEKPASQEANTQTVEETKWKEVMAVHDEVMPKMGEINRAKRQIKEKLEGMPEDVKTAAMETIQKLDGAEEAMMGWMSGFKPLKQLRGDMDHRAIVKYLDEEKTKIDKVKSLMLESLEEGKGFLTE